jgi:dihydropteroate synthase
MRTAYDWHLRSRTLELGRRTLVMGVVNVTPDSFSDGGKFLEPEHAIAHGLQLLDDGADLLDVGGESTRPGTQVLSQESGEEASVSEAEELRRVVPVIEGILRARPETVVSVDTYKSGVARRGITAGAEIVNDVSGFQWDEVMARACAELHCGVVLMHSRGRPTEWQNLPPEKDVVSLVVHDLANRLQVALDSGVHRSRIVIDPGFGFGKNMGENYQIVARLSQLGKLGFPVLAGTSRKSFLGRTAGKSQGEGVAAPSERVYGSLAAMIVSILNGAHIVRVHDVHSSVEAAAIADEVLAAR